jgi:iron complex outermembrane receptor protein
MHTGYKSQLIAGTSMLAIALSMPHAVSAQQAAGQQAQASRLEEITVTARRVEENIQKVPLAVVAVNEDVLTTQNILNLEDYIKVSPGLVSQAGFDGTWFWLRGLQGVARFFADAPADPAITGAMFDVTNVQLLKGPQGTLFGGSSVAGAIVTVPKKPSDVMEGFVDVTLGDYGRRSIQAAIGGPIVEDKLLFRVAFDSLKRKGYMCDTGSGKCYNDENHYIFRPAFTFKTENIESYTMFQYFYERTNGTVRNVTDYESDISKPYAVWYTVIALIQGGGNPVAGLPAAERIADGLLAQSKYRPFELNGYNIQQGFSGVKKRAIQVVNSTRWDITDNIAFTNIFQYRKNGNRSYIDNWNDSFFGFLPNDPRAIETKTSPLNMAVTWSDEAKFNLSLFDDFADITIGTFHKGEPTHANLNWSATAGSLSATIEKGSSRYPTLTRAIFGQAELDIGRYVNLDGLTFTAGYRQTWDTMSNSTTYLTVLPNVPTSQLKSRLDLRGKAYFSNDNWLFGLKWEYTPDTMFFFTASKAYTVGQTNPQYGAQYEVVNPEILKQLEFGTKSTFFLGDMQFRTNASLYYGWYSNIQVSVLRSIQQNPPPAPLSIIVPSVNAAQGLTRGFDVEFTALPTEWFELTGHAAYNKNKYTDWPVLNPTTGAVIGNQKNTIYVGTPKMVWDLSATFHVPMDEEYGKLSISAMYMHTSSTGYYAGANIGEYEAFSTQTRANGYGPLASDGAVVSNSGNLPYHNLDASVRWRDPMGITGLTSTFAVTNITKNREGYDGAYGFYSFGLQWKGVQPPRMFTFDLRYNF